MGLTEPITFKKINEVAEELAKKQLAESKKQSKPDEYLLGQILSELIHIRALLNIKL